jgi:hypothetical protein
MNDDERRDRIHDEAARIHESATYSSETQFEYAKRWRSVDRWIGSVAAGLAAVSGVGSLSKFIPVNWAGAIAILSALIGAVSASIAARQTTERATVAANLYRALQQDTRIFIQIDLGSLSTEDARDALQKLTDRVQQLNREAVIPSAGAWRRARRQIEAGAQSYEADK